MGKHEKFILKILSGSSDKNIDFNDLCQLLLRFGFSKHTRGSHHLFQKKNVQEKFNLQKDGNKAKSYQVKQVRYIIQKYKLGGIADV